MATLCTALQAMCARVQSTACNATSQRTGLRPHAMPPVNVAVFAAGGSTVTSTEVQCTRGALRFLCSGEWHTIPGAAVAASATLQELLRLHMSESDTEAPTFLDPLPLNPTAVQSWTEDVQDSHHQAKEYVQAHKKQAAQHAQAVMAVADFLGDESGVTRCAAALATQLTAACASAAAQKASSAAQSGRQARQVQQGIAALPPHLLARVVRCLAARRRLSSVLPNADGALQEQLVRSLVHMHTREPSLRGAAAAASSTESFSAGNARSKLHLEAFSHCTPDADGGDAQIASGGSAHYMEQLSHPACTVLCSHLPSLTALVSVKLAAHSVGPDAATVRALTNALPRLTG